MSWRKLILFSLVLFVSLYAKQSFAYETDTHAYLTDEAINFYNRNFSVSSVPENFRNYILDGARREDDGVRSFNHFYDPVNNIGLHEMTFGTWERSKDWANDSGNQDGLKYKVPAVIASVLSAVEGGKISDISSETNFTWHKAIEYYANGENEKSFFLLGHIVHLIEDTSVPDHTRNDLHIGDSPYENWAAQFNLQNKDRGLRSRLSSKSPVSMDNLNSYFDELATYSNNNFYSKNTIGIQSGYSLPTPVEYEKSGTFLLALNKDDDGYFPLFKQPGVTSVFIKNKNDMVFDSSDILSRYWSRLSTRSVQYSAGVLNLFIKEAEAAKNDPNLIKQKEQRSFIASIVDGAQGIVEAVGGAIQKAIGALENILKQNSAGTNESQTKVSPENSTNDTLTDVSEQIDSELIASEQVKENIEALQGEPEAVLTESEKSAITQMLARLNDLMQQAIELRTKIDAAGDGSIYRTVENQIVSIQNIGGGQVSQNITSSNSTTNSSGSTTSNVDNSGPVTSTSTESTVASIPTPIVISEFLFDAIGSDTGKEFIELYNPNFQSLNLTNWSLRYSQSDSTSTVSLASFKSGSHLEDNPNIPARGFLLVGLNGYDAINYGKSADIVRTAALPNGVGADGDGIVFTIKLLNGSSSQVDSAAYTSSSISAAGQSLERKAKLSDVSCVSASGNGEFLGNGCLATSTDAWEIHSKPNPQNSLSLPEPRQAPNFSGATVSYSSSSVSLDFNWNESADSSGATSTILFEIRDASSSEIFATTTGATATQKNIDEVGRNYNFIIQSFDRDGLGSATSSLVVGVSSFFDRFYFYEDPHSAGSNIIDAYYVAYPFVPGTLDMWKIVLFYINTDALKDEHLIEEGGFVPSDVSNIVSLNYLRCSGPGSAHPDNFLLLPEGAHCSSVGGGLYPQGITGLEDFHFIIPIAIPVGNGSITTSTYITAAFYDWESRGGSYAGFRLVAVDKQKYYFQLSAPSSTPPNPPVNITTQFDDLHSRLDLSWPVSNDPDSSDNLLSYEINNSSSTEFSASSWQPVGNNLTASVPVVSGIYKLGVRAIDDFSNVSVPVEKNWDFPEGFVQLPFQRESGGDPIGDSGGAGQRILISNDANISRVAMVMAMDGGVYSVTDTFIEIRSDNGGGMGNLISSSSDISRAWPMSDKPIPTEFIFNFPQPVALSAGTYYWLVPVNGPGISNRNFIYGTATDSYSDGYWSGNPGADAYFFIR